MAPRRDVLDPKGRAANMNGEMVYLWRAVDHEGEVLKSYVTRKRDKSAALAFMKKALKRHGKVEAIVTDGLTSYSAAMKELGNQDRRVVGAWRYAAESRSIVRTQRRDHVQPHARSRLQLSFCLATVISG
nr:DDE-type integrase/transposase/recombinase [Croceicoccus ponticola]